jgi:cellulose biosynthesis protein BcsQ
MKGGVGKTATVVALSEALAADNGADVLVIDLDAQANASICFAGDKLLETLISTGHTVDAFFDDYLFGNRKRTFSDCIRAQVSDVSRDSQVLPISLLASSTELRLLERRIVHRHTKAKSNLDDILKHLFLVMKDQLKRTTQSYEYIVIDCAPGIPILTEVSIRLADLVIVPTIADFMSTYGLQAFCHSIWRGELADTSPLARPKKSPRVLITRRKHTREQDKTAERLRAEEQAKTPSFRMFDVEIPETTDVPTALAKVGMCPTFSQKWGTKIPTVLSQLVDETKEALNGSRN